MAGSDGFIVRIRLRVRRKQTERERKRKKEGERETDRQELTKSDTQSDPQGEALGGQ